MPLRCEDSVHSYQDRLGEVTTAVMMDFGVRAGVFQRGDRGEHRDEQNSYTVKDAPTGSPGRVCHASRVPVTGDSGRDTGAAHNLAWPIPAASAVCPR